MLSQNVPPIEVIFVTVGCLHPFCYLLEHCLDALGHEQSQFDLFLVRATRRSGKLVPTRIDQWADLSSLRLLDEEEVSPQRLDTL